MEETFATKIMCAVMIGALIAFAVVAMLNEHSRGVAHKEYCASIYEIGTGHTHYDPSC